MKIIDSNLANQIEDVHINDFGNYYFLKGIVIAEVKEGVIFNWEASQDIINAAIKHYGNDLKICYITNRVNAYSVNPVDWLKFFKSDYNLNGYAIVTYTNTSWLNALVEKVFLSTKVKRFTSLYEAIDWAKQTNYNISLKKNQLVSK
ncbi:hypothetical protein [Lacinutrix salivirga]